MSIAQGIFALLAIIVVLLVLLSVKVNRAFRNLTGERIRAYTDHFGYLHDYAYALRHELDLPKTNNEVDQAFALIASFPALQASEDVMSKIADWGEYLLANAEPSEIEAAKQALDEALNECYIEMRKDLCLLSGDARFPNADILLRNRRKNQHDD